MIGSNWLTYRLGFYFVCGSFIWSVKGLLTLSQMERISSLPVWNLGNILMKCGKAACELVPEHDRVTSLLK